MKLSDYVVAFLIEKGVKSVFYLPGGGCMHLLDSLGSCRDIHAISLLHEQSVAIASEAYACTSGMPGVSLVTTGPGGTNTITGVLAAYLDSSPCFFLSGQVKTGDLKSNYGVRSHGSQEADIVSIVSSITKYAAMITDKDTVRYHLECAWHEMTSGRQGPVWLDIPLDVQGQQVVVEELPGFEEECELSEIDVTGIIAEINAAKRPIIIAGNGLSRYKNYFYELLELLQIPVIPTWKAMDYIPNNHPLYAGRAGGMGDRHGNLAMQNSDFLLSLGSRLDFSITGYNREEWAPKAKKIVIDIDPSEFKKLNEASGLIPVVSDVGEVIKALLARKNELQLNDFTLWKNQISEWKRKYPVIDESKHYSTGRKITSYAFFDVLSKNLDENAYLAPCSAGTTAEIFFQAFCVKKGQVIRSNHGLGAMGFEIPSAIGMCIASGGKDTVCIAGDGGIQLNIQELAAIRGMNLPVKIFVINNSGYASIRNMQSHHFEGRFVGCDESSGLFLPEFRKIAEAYGIHYFCADDLSMLETIVKNGLAQKGPVICEIIVEPTCFVSPRTATRIMPNGTLRSSSLENQFPFLTDDEMEGNMLV